MSPSPTDARVLAESELPAAEALLAAHPEATLYATPRWSALVRAVFGHPVTFLGVGEPGALRGVLPLHDVRFPGLGRKLLSVPWDVYSGGPFAADEESARALVAAACARARESDARYLQLRARAPLPGADELGLAVSQPLVVTRVAVTDEESAWAAVSKHHRRAVRTAAKKGVEVRRAAAADDVASFYGIYLSTFRDFGTPPYPRRYFQAVWDTLPAENRVLLIASKDGRDVGGMLLFAWHRTLVMKFGVALPEAVDARAYAALYWRALQLACERGLTDVNWGSSAPKQTGLLQFKERWGGASQPVWFHDLPLRGAPPDIEAYYDDQGLARRVWKRLPLPLTALLGGPLNGWFC